MTIQDVLLWVASGLGATFVFSYVAERWEKFQSLEFETKRLISTVVSSVLAISAFVIYTYTPPEVWVSLSPYWQLVLGVITVNYGKEIFHKYDKTLPQ